MLWGSIVPLSTRSSSQRIILDLEDERATGKLYGVR
jgi:hypothetical protein